jgi:apolipoprotein N-acyltransferase
VSTLALPQVVAGRRSRLDWRALGLALLAGLALGFAHPPWGVLPGLLGFAMMLALLERADPARPIRSAFLRGWAAGFGFFLVSLYWVAEAFFVDAAAHGWMAPIVMAILPGGMALFWGGACALARALGPREGRWAALRRAAVFAGSVGLFEWLRGHVLTGFPWNLPGEAWAAGSAPSQAASVLGAYGLSLLTVLLASAPAVLFASGSTSRGERLAAAGLSLSLLAGLYGFGAGRLAGATEADQTTTVRIVQGDIDQQEKWRPDNLDGVLDTYLRLTRAPGQAAVDVVIWPEGAIPSAANDYLGADVARRRRVAKALLPGQTLMTGAFRVDLGPDGDQRAYNTFLALKRVETPEGPDLQLVAQYDKHRLVPLGEFLPLRSLLEPIGFVTLVHAPEDFTPGPVPAPMSAPGLPRVQPLICYESLFPGLAATGPRAAWIVNASNDSWFGRTSGPWQHLNIASHRAIEQGLPVIRATSTGVSAVIDAYGRSRESLGIGVEGIIDTPLPAALPPTPAVALQDTLFFILTAFTCLLAVPKSRNVKIA